MRRMEGESSTARIVWLMGSSLEELGRAAAERCVCVRGAGRRGELLAERHAHHLDAPAHARQQLVGQVLELERDHALVHRARAEFAHQPVDGGGEDRADLRDVALRTLQRGVDPERELAGDRRTLAGDGALHAAASSTRAMSWLVMSRAMSITMSMRPSMGARPRMNPASTAPPRCGAGRICSGSKATTSLTASTTIPIRRCAMLRMMTTVNRS